MHVCVFQKRVVNVYRLITRGTLEEKIMGLQKFKMTIANTVITQENTSLQSMGTEQLLNLFTLDKVSPNRLLLHACKTPSHETALVFHMNICTYISLIPGINRNAHSY